MDAVSVACFVEDNWRLFELLDRFVNRLRRIGYLSDVAHLAIGFVRIPLLFFFISAQQFAKLFHDLSLSISALSLVLEPQV